jgi:hypothetical protein
MGGGSERMRARVALRASVPRFSSQAMPRFCARPAARAISEIKRLIRILETAAWRSFCMRPEIKRNTVR